MTMFKVLLIDGNVLELEANSVKEFGSMLEFTDCGDNMVARVCLSRMTAVFNVEIATLLPAS